MFFLFRKTIISRASKYDARGGEKEQLPVVPPFDRDRSVQERVLAVGQAPTVEQKVHVQIEVLKVLVWQAGAPATSCQQLRKTLPGDLQCSFIPMCLSHIRAKSDREAEFSC
jgi:hypothetical protein